MADANRGEASRCLDIARAAAAMRDFERAVKFADKSVHLYPCDEARKVSAAVKRQQNSSESSSSGAAPNGSASSSHRNGVPNGGAGLHSRRQAATNPGRAEADAQPSKPDNSTLEQKALVRRIRAMKDYYEMLGVQKNAGDDDLKRGYKKLALKLHPDKNQAAGSEQAFKAVSRAYACLSDPDKRAAYDRYGSEDPQQVGRSGGGFGGGGGFAGGDTMDANDLFNMFFGNSGGGVQGHGSPFGPGTRVYSTNFFGNGHPFGQQAQRRGREGAAPASSFGAIIQLIPIVLLLLFTFFSTQSSPDVSLDRQGDYKFPVTTGRYQVPYWVKSTAAHDSSYPDHSSARRRLEDTIEGQYKDRLGQLCQREKVAQMQAARWNRRKAQNMKTPHCDEFVERYGPNYNTYW